MQGLTNYNYKLTETELLAIVPAEEFQRIMFAANQRAPGQYAKHMVFVYLNKAETVWVQNVNFYGGEHFGKPYHFPAEIRHNTTESAFRRCTNRLGIHLRMAFTY